VPWSCNLADEVIEVYYDNHQEGRYSLAESPFCEVCAHPNVSTDKCTDHEYLDSIDRIYTMGWYIPSSNRTTDDLLSRHILRAKNDSSFVTPLGLAMAITARARYPELLNYELILPVPLYAERLAGRGYNQALELARIVSSELEIELLDGLEKTRNINFQGRRWQGRLEQIAGLYRINQNVIETVRDKNIILIDDVITTGLTVNKCAEVLKDSGASSVIAFTATRTRRD